MHFVCGLHVVGVGFVTVYMCSVWRCLCMFGGGYFIAMCLTWGVCVDSMCGLHVVWVGSCWGLFVFGGIFWL